MRSRFQDIISTADTKMERFMVPATGVIGALIATTREVEAAKTKAELERALSAKIGYSQTLPTLYLVVQEPHKQAEVQRLATELQRIVERQKSQLR